ncbi:MAG: helix-turn-helix domain-containing protein [Ginsengibacter sp.]
MGETDLQKELFVLIKNTLPSHISLVDAIADLLDISYDSVYRRIRGEKPISLNELKILCEHFHLSLDQILQFKNESVVFNAPEINGSDPDFRVYLAGVLRQMKYFNSFVKPDMLYQCKDAPFFYFYLYPEIGAFKTFCWLKTIINNPEYQDKVFSLHEFPFEECNKLGQQIIREYNILPSTELWNFESFNSSLNQLEYYRDAGLFKTTEDFNIVADSFDKMLKHLKEQASIGLKFMPGAAETSHKAPIKFYINEVLLGNNTIICELDGLRLSVITYNALNYLITKDVRLGEKLFRGFTTLTSRSTLISGTGEKERNKFFRIQHEKIVQLKEKNKLG